MSHINDIILFMKRIKILIIEDESIISIHIKNSVEKLGYEVVEIVRSSDEALSFTAKEKIDIALCDININGCIDGIETANILNSTYNIPIIFLTAYKDKDTLKRALNIEFIGYIVKPFRDDELETMINLAIIKHDLDKEKQIVIITDNYSYNFESDELLLNNNKVSLTSNESKLLKLLLNAKVRTTTYEIIDNSIWHEKATNDTSRRQLFHRLKTKLVGFPFVVDNGIGYRVDF